VLLGRVDPRPLAWPSSEADAAAAFVYSYGRGVGYSYANQIQFGLRGGGGTAGDGSRFTNGGHNGRHGGFSTTGGIVLPAGLNSRPTLPAVPAVHPPLTATSFGQEVANTAAGAPVSEQINAGQPTAKEVLGPESPAAANLLPIAEYGDFGELKPSLRLTSPTLHLEGEGQLSLRSRSKEQLLSKAVADSSNSKLLVKQVQTFDVVPAVPGLPVQPLPQ